VDAKDDLPNSFLVGDSNLSISGTNLSRGLVAVLTNMPLAWTERRHQKQGNVALADGSVQGFSNTRMREALRLSGLVTNRLAIP
jgi:prepilin-type processing-associated H-X9-DG protein